MGSPPRQARHHNGVSRKREDDELLSRRTRHRSPRRGSMSPPTSRRSPRLMNKQGGPSLMSPPPLNIGIAPLSSSSIQHQVLLFELDSEDNNIKYDTSKRRKSKSDKRVSIKESDGRIVSSLSAALDDDHTDEQQHSSSSNMSISTATTTKSSSPLGQRRLVCRRHTPLILQEDMPTSLTTIGEENQSSSPPSSSPPASSLNVMLLTTTTPNNGSPPRKKSHLPKLSPKKESMIMLSPPQPSRRHSRAISDMNFTNDFSLTPTILYKNASAGHPMSAGGGSSSSSSSSRTTRHYHQSPYWSGHVRINPFSPIPEQYLYQSSSREQGSRSSFRNPGYYNKYMINNQLEDPSTLQVLSVVEPPTLPTTLPHATKSHESRKKTRLIPHRSTSTTTSTTTTTEGSRININQEFINSEISPIDVAQPLIGADTISTMMSCTFKRKAADNDDLLMMKPPPQSLELVAHDWQQQHHQQQQQQHYCESINNDKRQRVKQGRYLDDFQEVKFLGSGSFGYVNACLSRLDGCMYAIKTITPSGRTMSTNHTTAGSSEIGTTTTTIMTASTGGEDDNHLYGGLRRSSKLSILLPPNPRGSPSRRRKSKSRINVLDMTAIDDNEDSHNKLDTFLEGSAHRNDGTLRRMLREVFALAALCQLSDFRTFYIVRYNQAWLEDDGALYIQTELCTATLRDEMMMIGNNTEMCDSILDTPTTFLRIDVFRQMKILREILLALELVHQRGMVHLDIKPDNIFRKNDVYKLGDFGLAHAFSSTMRNGGQTDIISDVEEGDSRYMSKDLLAFGPKDLTKVNRTLSYAQMIVTSYALYNFSNSVFLCFLHCYDSVIYFHLVLPCMKYVLDNVYPLAVKNGMIYEMETYVPSSLGRCHVCM